MRDVCRFLNHLHDEGVGFDAVAGVDVRAYAEQRRHEVAAATWAPEEAALMSLFRFCTDGDESGWRLFDRNPWPLWRTARGERSAVRRPADTVPNLPKFLDDDELAHFLSVGVRGVDPCTGMPLPGSWPVAEPLVPERDAAFVSLLLATGARMSEGRLVLIDEIPTDPGRRPWPSIWMRLGGERAKTKGGEAPFHEDVGRIIGAWYRSNARADMVDRAQQNLARLRAAGDSGGSPVVTAIAVQNPAMSSMLGTNCSVIRSTAYAKAVRPVRALGRNGTSQSGQRRPRLAATKASRSKALFSIAQKTCACDRQPSTTSSG